MSIDPKFASREFVLRFFNEKIGERFFPRWQSVLAI